MGRAVAAELVRGGRRVRVVNRSGHASGLDDVEVVQGDASDPAFTRAAAACATVVYQALNPGYRDWPELFPPLQASVLAGRRPLVPGSSPSRTCICTDPRTPGR